jgi:hypothetical protein
MARLRLAEAFNTRSRRPPRLAIASPRGDFARRAKDPEVIELINVPRLILALAHARTGQSEGQVLPMFCRFPLGAAALATSPPKFSAFLNVLPIPPAAAALGRRLPKFSAFISVSPIPPHGAIVPGILGFSQCFVRFWLSPLGLKNCKAQCFSMFHVSCAELVGCMASSTPGLPHSGRWQCRPCEPHFP